MHTLDYAASGNANGRGAPQWRSRSLRHYVASGLLGNFKSEPPSSVEKRRLTTRTKAVVQFDHDRMRSVHPVQVTGVENLSLRALDVEFEKINILKTAFPYYRRNGQPLDRGTLAIRRFDLEGTRVILLVCDDDRFWPMPHRRMNSANSLIPPRVPQKHLIVARIGLYRDNIRPRKG